MRKIVMKKRFRIRPMTGSIGAEVLDIDLSKKLDRNTVDQIRGVLLDYLVVFFRDQNLTPEQHIAFAEYFGEPDTYPFIKGLDNYPQITPVLKLENETTNFGGIWHSDTVYLSKPPMGTILYARELPKAGGDTLFANQYLAYSQLSPVYRDFLEKLTAKHSAAKGRVAKTRENRTTDRGTGLEPENMESEHPVIRTHPETGRKVLYVNYAHTVGFKGMNQEESTPILAYLFEHQVRPEFCCRFRWEPGSLAFWDNRSTQHNPVNDYHGSRRLLHRITLKGDKPF